MQARGVGAAVGLNAARLVEAIAGLVAVATKIVAVLESRSVPVER
jgi:hypothetical protein